MRVGPDQGVWYGDCAALRLSNLDDPAEPLEVYLVTDPHAGRDHPKVAKGLLRPAEQGVALAVALVFLLDVPVEGKVCAERVDLDGMVDHQVGRHQGIDQARIFPSPLYRGAHGGQVDHGWDTGEILEQHPARCEGQLGTRLGWRRPRSQAGHAFLFNAAGLGISQKTLEEDLHSDR